MISLELPSQAITACLGLLESMHHQDSIAVGCGIGIHLNVLTSLQSALYTIFPPTIVATTFPVNCQPSNGVLRDSDLDLAASNVQRFLGSKMVTSAKLPRASDPRPRRSKTRAGPEEKSSTMRVSGILCSRCSFVIASASAVSRPVMPKAARSNSTSFSCKACGA